MDISLKLENLIQQNKAKIKFASFSDETISLAHELLNDKSSKTNLFITEGMWAIPKIIYNKSEVGAFIFCPESIKSEDGFNAVKHFIGKTNVYVISEKVLNRLTKRNDDNGIYCIVKMPEYDIAPILSKQKSIVCVLDGIEKPGNIGTILRTCDATNIDLVMVVNRRAKVTNTLCVKGSMGAIFNVPIKTYATIKDCWQDLKNNGFEIYLADTRAETDYFNFKYANKTALVMGSERYGISKDWYENNPKLLKLKMLGQCDSLNVGVATSILLYDVKMKQLGE